MQEQVDNDIQNETQECAAQIATVGDLLTRVGEIPNRDCFECWLACAWLGGAVGVPGVAVNSELKYHNLADT
tara:strand:- start:36520 stop:36735 length:216 start_codon:yes stop_codon:yes gene_type:complete